MNHTHQPCPFCKSSDAFSYRDDTGLFGRFIYLPKVGKLFDLKYGRIPGWLKHDGYWQVSHMDVKYYAHRVIWLLNYGYWPNVVDHIDRDRANNKIDNLREVNALESSTNKSGWGKSGVKGVWWDSHRGLWISQVRHKGKAHFVGRFHNIEDAKRARDKKAKELHKEFFSA